MDLRTRFERSVDRTGEHHLWGGAVDPARRTGRIKVDGKVRTAHRVAWELAHGPLSPGERVHPCSEEPTCVRVEHLRCEAGAAGVAAPRTGRAKKGSGSIRQTAPGTWKLSVTVAASSVGKQRRVHKTVSASTTREAAEELAAFVAEVRDGVSPALDARSTLIDDAVERFLTEHLQDERGREDNTIRDYRGIHRKWFAPSIGRALVRDVDAAAIDRVFARMRRAGLSRSRMNQARSLYQPFFRWARARGLTRRDPMANFILPRSQHKSSQRTPPEAEELALLLKTALEITPDIAPLLALGAVTGMRRGELVGIRRSRIDWQRGAITVDTAVDGKRLKGTKTGEDRTCHVDDATLAMLRRLCDTQDELAEVLEGFATDPFLFSSVPDAGVPLPPDYVTKRVARLKSELGIEVKQPDTIERENEALRLFRETQADRPKGRTGPDPVGGHSFAEIGRRLGRSGRWAAMAVATAARREDLERRGRSMDFDGSVIALRKFTSSELLDAGFNISVVAQRQGHGPQVLTKHYSRSRRSADRRAAEHLGAIVHPRSAAG